MEQTTNTILMIRPINFRMNEQTAVNNYYQKILKNILPETVNAKAQQEFDVFVEKLTDIGVNVIVVSDTNENDTPDSIFPNNWISFHENGTVGLYPMFAKNRRLERREDVLQQLEAQGYKINNIMDYTSAEDENIFLEGTGCLVLDRINRNAYCALSPRSDEGLLIEFCEDFEYIPIIFSANQTVNRERLAIYHTNVMMYLGETFAVICLNSIDNKTEQKNVVEHLKATNKEIINITESQANTFAGNVLQVKGKDEAPYIVMSQAAYNSLSKNQIIILEKHGKILYSSLDTIEACGGGSARCMIAEVFLPKTN
jgi:hypothetical protein